MVVRLDLRAPRSGRDESNQTSASCNSHFRPVGHFFSHRRWSSDPRGPVSSKTHLTIRTETAHGAFRRDSAWAVHETQSVPRLDRGSVTTHRQKLENLNLNF